MPTWIAACWSLSPFRKWRRAMVSLGFFVCCGVSHHQRTNLLISAIYSDQVSLACCYVPDVVGSSTVQLPYTPWSVPLEPGLIAGSCLPPQQSADSTQTQQHLPRVNLSAWTVSQRYPIHGTMPGFKRTDESLLWCLTMFALVEVRLGHVCSVSSVEYMSWLLSKLMLYVDTHSFLLPCPLRLCLLHFCRHFLFSFLASVVSFNGS